MCLFAPRSARLRYHAERPGGSLARLAVGANRHANAVEHRGGVLSDPFGNQRGQIAWRTRWVHARRRERAARFGGAWRSASLRAGRVAAVSTARHGRNDHSVLPSRIRSTNAAVVCAPRRVPWPADDRPERASSGGQRISVATRTPTRHDAHRDALSGERTLARATFGFAPSLHFEAICRRSRRHAGSSPRRRSEPMGAMGQSCAEGAARVRGPVAHARNSGAKRTGSGSSFPFWDRVPLYWPRRVCKKRRGPSADPNSVKERSGGECWWS